jgi:hypothetical protein
VFYLFIYLFLKEFGPQKRFTCKGGVPFFPDELKSNGGLPIDWRIKERYNKLNLIHAKK